MMAEALSIREEVLGSDHPDTKGTREDLHAIRHQLFSSQEQGILQAIPLLEKALGVNHPITQAKRQELADLRAQNRRLGETR
jgi:Tetratricopeptide repeat